MNTPFGLRPPPTFSVWLRRIDSAGLAKQYPVRVKGGDVVSDDKARENRLRRLAKRRGLVLQKSRRRDPSATDYGRYFLIIAEYNGMWGSQPDYGLSLDDVETWLTEERVGG